MIAKRLSEKGMSGKEIAKKMGVTPAAVTQYLKKSRGTSTIKNKKVNQAVDDLVEKLLRKELTERQKIQEFCRLCKTVRDEGLICDLHKELAGLEKCDACPSCS
jgi:hypothetical protein